jgi:HlyD family secretion protein
MLPSAAPGVGHFEGDVVGNSLATAETVGDGDPGRDTVRGVEHPTASNPTANDTIRPCMGTIIEPTRRSSDCFRGYDGESESDGSAGAEYIAWLNQFFAVKLPRLPRRNRSWLQCQLAKGDVMDSPVIDPRAAPHRNGELMNRVQAIRFDDKLDSNAGIGARGGIAWLPWILCIGLAFTWAGYGIRSYRNAAPASALAPSSADSPSASTGTAAPVSTANTAALPATPTVATGTAVLEVKGYLVPARQISVSPIDVSGRVVELNVIEGKKYQIGDVLAKIEDVSFRAMTDEAKAALASATKKLEGSRARLAMLMPQSVRPVEIVQVEEELREATASQGRAQDEVDRLSKLGTGTAAEKELNQARFDVQAANARVLRLRATLEILKEGPRKEQKDAAEADVRGSEAEVKAAEARVAQAEWRLTNCIIRAPIAGTVLAKKAELFNLANPNAFSVTSGGASGSICDMADLSDLEVDLEVAVRDVQKLTGVKRARVRCDAFADRVYEGTLDRIMPIANRNAGTITVRVKVKLPPGEEPGTLLKPQMGAVVTFVAGT